MIYGTIIILKKGKVKYVLFFPLKIGPIEKKTPFLEKPIYLNSRTSDNIYFNFYCTVLINKRDDNGTWNKDMSTLNDNFFVICQHFLTNNLKAKVRKVKWKIVKYQLERLIYMYRKLNLKNKSKQSSIKILKKEIKDIESSYFEN